MTMRVAAILMALASTLVLLLPEVMTASIGVVTGWWLPVLAVPVLWLSSGFLVLGLVLLIGPWGRLRLGAASDRPEFGTLSWLAMLFAAGMGSGLVFWGVAEPLTHLVNPPLAGLDQPGRQALSLAVTHFHWGLHAWAIYAIAGLVIAWFSYRYQAPESPSGALRHGFAGWLPPLWLRGLGVCANVLAIIAVVFGVAGALANGTILLQTGLARVLGGTFPMGLSYALILAVMSIAFLASASSGIRQGIRWLSVFNMLLALVLLVALFILSDTTAILAALWQGAAEYGRLLLTWSWRQPVVDGSLGWSSGWTITYLLWWIAWAPFVGIFIARISRGRSIRSYILGVLGVPVVFSMIWFTVLGGGAMAWDEAHGGVLAQAVQSGYTEPLFVWFEGIGQDGLKTGGLNVGPGLGWLACLLLFVFLVTSADSAAYVLGMLSQHGDPDPPTRSKLVWGGLTVLLAAGLLIRGSPDVIKTIAIVGAIPFTALLLLQVLAWLRSFTMAWHDHRAGLDPPGD